MGVRVDWEWVYLYRSQGPMMVGAKTFTTGITVFNGPITVTREVGVAFQLLQRLLLIAGAGVGPVVGAVVAVVLVVVAVVVHAALISPPRMVIPSPTPTVDPPHRVITTEEGESHRHPRALFTFVNTKSKEQFQVAVVMPAALVAAVKRAVMVDPSLENWAERNVGGGAGLSEPRTANESP